MKVVKMTNISNVQIPVELTNGTTVYLPPREVIENVSIENYEAITSFVKAEVRLNEPKESKSKTKRMYLKD